MLLSDVPSPGQVQSWLTTAGLLGQGSVRLTGVNDAGKAGAGMLGDVRRMTLDYEDPDSVGPRSIIAKMPVIGAPESLALSNAEHDFYASGIADIVGLTIPRPLFLDAAGGIFLEDLGDDGFVPQIVGYTAAQAQVAIIEIAKLHRGSSSPMASGYSPAVPVASPVAEFCRREFDWWDGGWPAMLGDIPPVLVRNFDRIAELLEANDSTVAHGDFHSGNIHLAGVTCTLIDFQFVQSASGMVDVARLLATSIRTETRREVERDLLSGYESASGSTINVGALRAGIVWSFAVPLAIHISAMRESGRRDWPERMPILERSLAMADDWDAMSVVV